MTTNRLVKNPINTIQSKIISKLGSCIHGCNIRKNQHLIPYILNILYVAIHNIDKDNCGNKSLLENYISNLISKYNLENPAFFSSFSEVYLRAIQKIILNNLQNNPKAKFFEPPSSMTNSYELARPIIKLCQYYYISVDGIFSLSALKANHYFDLITAALKTLLTPGDKARKYQHLLALRDKEIEFRTANNSWLDYGKDYDINKAELGNYNDLTHILALAIFPFTSINQSLKNAGVGSVSSSLTAITLDYLQEGFPQEFMPNFEKKSEKSLKFSIARELFFALDKTKSVSADIIADLITEYSEEKSSLEY